MIKVIIKMMDNQNNDIIEELFTKYGYMARVTGDLYIHEGNKMGTVFARCKDLIDESWFRDNMCELIWVVDDEIEELKDYLTKANKKEVESKNMTKIILVAKDNSTDNLIDSYYVEKYGMKKNHERSIP